MNNAQKLADEALQVYRATGLSPLEVLEQRNALILKAHTASNILWNHGRHDVSREIDSILERCK